MSFGCDLCYGFGWTPWGPKRAVLLSHSTVRLVIACPCNKNRAIPPPRTPGQIAAIFDEPLPARPPGEF